MYKKNYNKIIIKNKIDRAIFCAPILFHFWFIKITVLFIFEIFITFLDHILICD